VTEDIIETVKRFVAHTRAGGLTLEDYELIAGLRVADVVAALDQLAGEASDPAEARFISHISDQLVEGRR
jgi:hypothetical protein